MKPKRQKNRVALPVASVLLLDLASTGRAVPRMVLKQLLEGRVQPGSKIHINPDAYTCAEDFRVDYQAVSILKKFPSLGLVTPQQREQNALAKWVTANAQCAVTNEKFKWPYRSIPDDQMALLYRARSFIRRVLGTFSWDAALRYCDYGPGATVSLKRTESDLANKVSNRRPTATRGLQPLCAAKSAYYPLLRGLYARVQYCTGGVVFTVPKDSEVDRVAMKEPDENAWFQHGIGGLIRSRIRHHLGVDLNTQHRVNGELARLGSLHGTYATLDLKSASDSLALGLCEFLLDEEWFTAMCVTRSPYATLPSGGDPIALEMIGTMGNGFTWELESLVFLALVWAACPTANQPNVDIATFGDDIICRPEAAPQVIKLLEACGFTINREKSYVNGPFRESCGSNFFDGVDVTPFRIDKDVVCVEEAYWLANSISALASRWGAGLYRSAILKDAYDLAVSCIPRRFRLPIPLGIGDVGLVSCFDEATPHVVMTRWGTRQLACRVFTKIQRARRLGRNRAAWLRTKLYVLSHRAVEPGVISQRATEASLMKQGRLRTHVLEKQWPYIGPWC